MVSLKFTAYARNEPLVISTLEGRIRIWRVSSRELRFELPPGVKVFHSEELADRTPVRFSLTLEEEQAIEPEQEGDDHGDRDPRDQPVADVAVECDDG